MPIVTFFGSSGAEPESNDYNIAGEIGSRLASNGFDIATGGYSGIMEAALRGAAESDVAKIGVITDFYAGRKPNKYVTKVIRTATYMERLEKLLEIAGAFIAMPGGNGTFLEITAAWALKSRGLLKSKPIVCVGGLWLNIFGSASAFSDNMRNVMDLIIFVNNVDDAVNAVIEGTEWDN